MLRFLLALFIGASAVAADAPRDLPAKDRIVVLISIDGFPAWIWKDPTLVVPNLRKLAAEGAQAEAMTVSNPSITWINHTTLVTGVNPQRHGVLFNGLLTRGESGQPPILEQWRDKADLVHVPTLYDLAFQSGLKTAQVDWVAILNSGTIHHEFLEVPKPGGTTEQELVKAGVVSADDIRTFTKGKTIVWRDAIWAQAATHIIEQHQPNLLLLHFLTTDATNHQFGPGSLPSITAYAYVDRLVGDVLDSLTRAGLRDRATIVVATDHGFKKVTKAIYPNVALRDAGLIRLRPGETPVTTPPVSTAVATSAKETPAGTTKETPAVNADAKVADCDAYVMSQGGLAFVYVTTPAKRAELLPKLKALFANVEGVDQVIDGAEGHRLGMPTPDENRGMGDLILYAKAGYAFKPGHSAATVVEESKNYLGTHGYIASDPELDGIFIASGYGIRKGVKLPRVANLDVAPTLATFLGVKLPNPDGRVLTEILSEPAK